MFLKEKHKIPDNCERQRLNRYIYESSLFQNLRTGKSVQKAIKREEIYVNGRNKPTSYFISPGDVIEYIYESDSINAKIFRLPLDVVYEDEQLALIDKPAGFDVNGNSFRTIENSLPFNLKVSKSKDRLKNPVPVHRLDNPTRGLLLVAKTFKARTELSKQFEKRVIKKEYEAVVTGKPDDLGSIDLSIGNRSAFTEYETISRTRSIRWGDLALVKAKPVTGRKHQIRYHFSEIGSPVLGDRIYQSENLLKSKGLFLFSTYIEFIHPESMEKLSFRINSPDKFRKIIETENKNHLKYGIN